MSLDPEGHRLYTMEFAIRWGDMDALGHVNNTMYFRYFEQIRLQWYESMGFDVLGGGTEGMVIVDNHAEYLKPLVYPAHVTLCMGGHSAGRSSFISTYTLSVDEVLFTRGQSKVVWVRNEPYGSIPLPDAVRALLDG